MVELENVVVSAPAGVLPERMKAPQTITRGDDQATPCLSRRVYVVTRKSPLSLVQTPSDLTTKEHPPYAHGFHTTDPM